MAGAYTLSQKQFKILEKVISSIVKNDEESFSPEDLGMIKHIISPEDFGILRQNLAVMRESSYVQSSKFSWSYSELSYRETRRIEGGPLPLKFEYKPLLGVIENIFQHAPLKAKSALQENSQDINEKIDGIQRPTEGLELDSNTQRAVYELYFEMITRCACGVDDAHEVALALFDSLHDYNSSTAQVLLIVAAFAMNIGEFWLTVQPMATEDHLSRSVNLLKRPQCLLQLTDSLKSGLESVRTLVERIWDLTKWLVEFDRLESSHQRQFPLSEELLICYQIVYGVVICLSHNIALMRMNKEYTTLATEVQQMRNSSERLAYLHSFAYAWRRQYENMHFAIRCGMGNGLGHEDIAKYISRLMSPTGKLLLGHSSTKGYVFTIFGNKGKVPLEKLKASMCIAFFISDFKVQEEEFSSLIKTYKVLTDEATKWFEVIWVPMMDDQSTTWTADNKRRVSNMGASMPWYWVYDPSTIKPSFLQRVKEEWHFQGVPILVILDRRGYLMHTNALPMLEIWGPSAYPFTKKVEEQLHKGLSDAIDYMFSANDKPNMQKWDMRGEIYFRAHYNKQHIKKRAEEGKIICFYGSYDKNWITRFLQKMELIAVQTNFEMVITYVGTNQKKEELPSILTSIDQTRASFIKTKNSRVWSNEEILSFWHNLEMSKSLQTMKVDVPVRKEFISILSFDEHEDGWALIFCDSKQEIVKSYGNKLIEFLDSFTTSGSGIQEPKDFLRELNEGLRVKHATQEHGESMTVPTEDHYPISKVKFCRECESFMY